MVPYVTKLHKNLDKQLQEIDLKEEDGIKKSQESIGIIKNALPQLKKYISEHPFKDEQEEILFFKYHKPEIVGKLLYHLKFHEIESRRPMGSFEKQKAYYLQHLESLTYFFNNHADFYHYYRMNSIFLDDKYFVRGKENYFHSPDNLSYYLDPDFSTSHDLIVAQIKANDRLEIYLKNEIEMLTIRETNPNWGQSGSAGCKKLVWTVSKVALVEVAYALFAAGAFNHGKCDISEIVAYFEQIFSYRINGTYRTFMDIKKRNNPTQFLDSLKTSLLRVLEEKL
ncbi:MAG: RteC domain-containing protein [Bacteroidota bacterium]|nr:RteC domain-containing protein [Bacteroidota bacterium]